MSLLPGPAHYSTQTRRTHGHAYGSNTLFNGTKRRILVLGFCIGILLLILAHRDDAISVHFRDLGYATRPLWEKSPERFKNVIKVDNNLSIWKGIEETSSISKNVKEAYNTICRSHGLQPSENSEKEAPKIYDVIIFSIELDLLEIRLRELYNIVDYFVIVESNITFSGDYKPYILKENQNQFEFAKDKIIYETVTDLHSSSSSNDKSGEDEKKEDPFKNEIKMRSGVSKIIDSLIPSKGSIIIQSDVDEIPSSHAISLLKYCQGLPDIIHLGMPSYLYSFEFPMERSNSIDLNNGEGAGPRQWRASAKKYGSNSYNGYTHSRQSDTILENAGWHLTFAFKYIDDFIFKMKSYSHNDRVTSPNLLSPEVIQDKICTGADIYNMLPEAYDFKSLLNQWGRIPPSTSTQNIPKSVLEHKDRFSYLLPGGCKRQLHRPT